MDIQLIPAWDRPEQIGPLFQEYTNMLIEGDPAFAEYLRIQKYDQELLHLEEKYAPPGGRLYLALADGRPAGCIGLRRLDEKRCEMKRLYVRPAFRGLGLGGRLVKQVVGDAGEIGYSCMLLDTLPFLESALMLYRRYGFRETERYNDSPLAHSIYMRLDLQ